MLIRLGSKVCGLPPGVNSFGLQRFGAVLRHFCSVVRLGFEVLVLHPGVKGIARTDVQGIAPGC